jgi:hypothetical protein
MFGRWIVRTWAALSGAFYLLLLFTAQSAGLDQVYFAGGDGIAMAIMIFLMTVEAR